QRALTGTVALHFRARRMHAQVFRGKSERISVVETDFEHVRSAVQRDHRRLRRSHETSGKIARRLFSSADNAPSKTCFTLEVRPWMAASGITYPARPPAGSTIQSAAITDDRTSAQYRRRARAASADH